MSNTKKEQKHVHLESDRGWSKQLDRYGLVLATIDRMCGPYYQGEYEVEFIRLKIGVTDQDETLVVVGAYDAEGTPVVCFSSAMTPAEALASAINRIENGQAKWRIDEYRQK